MTEAASHEWKERGVKIRRSAFLAISISFRCSELAAAGREIITHDWADPFFDLEATLQDRALAKVQKLCIGG